MQDKIKKSLVKNIKITVEKSEEELEKEKQQAAEIKKIILEKAIEHFHFSVKNLTIEKLYKYIQERDAIAFLDEKKLSKYTEENARQLFHFILTNNKIYEISALKDSFKFDIQSEIYKIGDSRLIDFYGKENFTSRQSISFFQLIVLDALYFNVGADVINQFTEESDQILIRNQDYKIVAQVTNGLIEKTKWFCQGLVEFEKQFVQCIEVKSLSKEKKANENDLMLVCMERKRADNELGQNVVNHNDVAYLENSEQRAPYQIYVHNGFFYRQICDKYFTPASTLHLDSKEKTGWGIVVMNLQGEIFTASFKDSKMQHSSLLAGMYGQYAGEIQINSKGTVTGITDYSGHYRPLEMHVRNFLKILVKNDIDLSQCFVYITNPLTEMISDKMMSKEKFNWKKEDHLKFEQSTDSHFKIPALDFINEPALLIFNQVLTEFDNNQNGYKNLVEQMRIFALNCENPLEIIQEVNKILAEEPQGKDQNLDELRAYYANYEQFLIAKNGFLQFRRQHTEGLRKEENQKLDSNALSESESKIESILLKENPTRLDYHLFFDILNFLANFYQSEGFLEEHFKKKCTTLISAAQQIIQPESFNKFLINKNTLANALNIYNFFDTKEIRHLSYKKFLNYLIKDGYCEKLDAKSLLNAYQNYFHNKDAMYLYLQLKLAFSMNQNANRKITKWQEKLSKGKSIEAIFKNYSLDFVTEVLDFSANPLKNIKNNLPNEKILIELRNVLFDKLSKEKSPTPAQINKTLLLIAKLTPDHQLNFLHQYIKKQKGLDLNFLTLKLSLVSELKAYLPTLGEKKSNQEKIEAVYQALAIIFDADASLENLKHAIKACQKVINLVPRNISSNFSISFYDFSNEQDIASSSEENDPVVDDHSKGGQCALKCLKLIKIAKLKTILIENPAISKILCDIKMPKGHGMPIPTSQEARALNQLREITLENLLKCFPSRSEEIKNLLKEDFTSSLTEIKEEQKALDRAKFYGGCFHDVYYFIRLVVKNHQFKIKATDRFPIFEDPNDSENVLDIIERAVEAILKMAGESENENPGKFLAKYHMTLFQNFVWEKNIEKSASQIDFMRLSILEKEVKELPKILSIENLNHILKEIEYLRYVWREALYQQKFGDEENNDKEFFDSPVKFLQKSPSKSHSSPVRLEEKNQKSPSTFKRLFSIN